MKVIQEKDSPIFERKTCIVEIEHPGKPTPSRKEIKQQIAKKYQTQENLIAIEKVKTNFGLNSLRVNFNIYKDEKLKDFLEVKKKKDKKEEEQKEAPKEEKTKEKQEVKEEPKEEKAENGKKEEAKSA